MADRGRPTTGQVARVQAAYFAVTGVWSLLSRRSFEAVTGSKRDYWLVQVVGALVSVIGASLAAASWQRRGSDASAVRILGVGSAACLAVADLTFVGRGRISRIYLADAAAEAAIVAAWAVARREDGSEGV